MQTFFERTAYSRDANGFLDQYHRVDSDRFLLLIPKLNDVEAVETFIGEIKYLVQLELYPNLLFCELFIGDVLKQLIKTELCSGEFGLVYAECNSHDWVAKLKQLGEERVFYKYMLVDRPMQTHTGELINLLHLNMTMPPLDAESNLALEWLRPFLEHLGPAFSMQMVAPGKVLEELFTKRGAGTLISLGYQFSLKTIAQIESQRLIELLEKGFMRHLKPTYLAELKREKASVLLEKDYRGAIVIRHFEAFHYLDKVVVAPEYFGRGMGSLLLDELTDHLAKYSLEHPKLIWRARPDNPFLHRYAILVYDFAKRYPGCCGTLSDGHYVYHFIGLDHSERERAYRWMRDFPSSFSS